MRNLSGLVFDFRFALHVLGNKKVIVRVDILCFLRHKFLRLLVCLGRRVKTGFRLRLNLWVGNLRNFVVVDGLLELFGFLVLLDEILNLFATFLDLLSEFLLDA